MSGLCRAAALLSLALLAPNLPAQGFVIAAPGPVYGFPGGFGGHVHHHLAFSVGGFYAPYGYGYAVNQVAVVVPSRVVVVPSFPDDFDLDLLHERLHEGPPPQGEQHFGGFHKVEPPAGRRPAPEPIQAPAPAQPPQPAQLPAPAIPPVPAPPKPMPAAPPPVGPPDLPQPPAPLNDPTAESARLLGLGRDAFANQEYGRAADRFRQAAALQPNQSMPAFLLAEALFAQGKYHDAVDAISAGMALQPDWPNARFRPLELYGPHAGDYADHLKALQNALDRRPGDPDLLFLDAYALWFDGRKDDALALFRKALPGAADPALIGRFLRAGAGPAAL